MKKVGIGCLVLFGVILLVNLVLVTGSHEQHPSPTAQNGLTTPEAVISPHDRVATRLKLTYDWFKEADVLMKANFTIKNNSDYAVKDFEITCEHYAPSSAR